MNPNELLQQRKKLLEETRAILKAADDEKRGMTAEEETRFNKLHDDAAELQTRAEMTDRQDKLEREMGESQGTVAGQRDSDGSGDGANADPESRAFKEREDAQMRAFDSYLRNGTRGFNDEEVRALQMDSDEAGGYLTAPQRFVTQLIKAVDDMVFIRPLATKQQLNQAQSLGVPSLDADPADADTLLIRLHSCTQH